MTSKVIALIAIIGVLSALLLAICALGTYCLRYKQAGSSRGTAGTRYRKKGIDDAIRINSLLYTTTIHTRTPNIQTPSSASYMRYDGEGPLYSTPYHPPAIYSVPLPAPPHKALRSPICHVAVLRQQEENLIGDVRTTNQSPGDIASQNWEGWSIYNPKHTPKRLGSFRTVTSSQSPWTPMPFSPGISTLLDSSDRQRPSTMSSYATAKTSVTASFPSGAEENGYQAEIRTPSSGLESSSLLQGLASLIQVQGTSSVGTGTGDMTQTVQTMIEALRQSANFLQQLASPRLSVGQRSSLTDTLPQYTSAPASTGG